MTTELEWVHSTYEYTHHFKNKTSRKVTINRWVANVDFGCVDQKGRKIGSTLQVSDRIYSTLTEEERPLVWWTEYKLECKFESDVHVTRSGLRFGALHRVGLMETLEEAKADCIRRMEASKKRYVRQYGK